MRKLSKSFFWIDQEIVRSGLWSKMSARARLCYVALVASVNREGLSLWGELKLSELAGVTKEEWADVLSELSLSHLIELPSAGEIGIQVLPLNHDDASPSGESKSLSRFESQGGCRPILVRTVTTVEMDGVHAQYKVTK